MTFNKLIQQLKGGSGSGNFGHSGIPGKVGGSAPGGGNGGGGAMSTSHATSIIKKLFGRPVTIQRHSTGQRKSGTLMRHGKDGFKLVGGFNTYKFDQVKRVLGRTIDLD